MARLVFAPRVCCCCELFANWRVVGSVGRDFILTSSSDHLCKSCMNSAGRGCLVRLLRPKHACLAFSQIRLLGELLVAKLERGVLSFLPM